MYRGRRTQCCDWRDSAVHAHAAAAAEADARRAESGETQRCMRMQKVQERQTHAELRVARLSGVCACTSCNREVYAKQSLKK